MKISLGLSPCPNDTYIFGALLNGWIPASGLEFIPFFQDVEALNRLAYAQKLHVTKLSYNAMSGLLSSYNVLDAGSALGRGCGPLLIARTPISSAELPGLKIGIPGEHTTANFLFSKAFPKAKNKKELLFSMIEPALLKGEIDAGVIIHENRFTYQEKGLVKILDLGAFWETHTGFPIPLGGIAASKKLAPDIQHIVNKLIRQSLLFAKEHPDKIMPFVRRYAQEMDDAVMRNHIDLYVNDYSERLGKEGKGALKYFFSEATHRNGQPQMINNLTFIQDE